ncbi:MAG: hypothetical protein K2H43_07155 [Clostridia bacterium]|nr:hypothetical protein [Clostridia bacterium]
MQCSRCGKNGAKRYILQGKEIFLCESCCAKTRVKRAAVCPECGTALEEFRKTGLVGCADCYTAFRTEIIELLGRMQGGTRHTGKVQSAQSKENYEVTHELVREYEYVKSELERAMLGGDYRSAESWKEKLKELHRKLFPEKEEEA